MKQPGARADRLRRMAAHFIKSPSTWRVAGRRARPPGGPIAFGAGPSTPSEDSVDDRITEILAAKRRAFGGFVRASELADAVPEAMDVSDPDLARRVVSVEQERLLYRAPEVVAPDDKEWCWVRAWRGAPVGSC